MPFAQECLDAGYVSLRDIPELAVDQVTQGTATLTLRDPKTGAPVDLTSYTVRARAKESPDHALVTFDKEATITDPEAGEITFEYTKRDTRAAGIFTAEAQLFSNDTRKHVYPFFFTVNPSLSGQQNNSRQMLSIAEIRMTMRDSDPEANLLLDALEFNDNEIALMIRRCVDHWNETPPPVGRFTAANFPFRYHLALAVVAQLYRTAAVHKLRNDLPYNAGGLTVQDTAKWQQYKQLGDTMWQEWAQWVRHMKYQRNISGAYAQLGGYSPGRLTR